MLPLIIVLGLTLAAFVARVLIPRVAGDAALPAAMTLLSESGWGEGECVCCVWPVRGEIGGLVRGRGAPNVKTRKTPTFHFLP